MTTRRYQLMPLPSLSQQWTSNSSLHNAPLCSGPSWTVHNSRGLLTYPTRDVHEILKANRILTVLIYKATQTFFFKYSPADLLVDASYRRRISRSSEVVFQTEIANLSHRHSSRPEMRHREPALPMDSKAGWFPIVEKNTT